jgi:hypothetical protein
MPWMRRRQLGPAAYVPGCWQAADDRRPAALGRDIVYEEDRSQVRTDNGPRVMASLRDLAAACMHKAVGPGAPGQRPRNTT